MSGIKIGMSPTKEVMARLLGKQLPECFLAFYNEETPFSWEIKNGEVLQVDVHGIKVIIQNTRDSVIYLQGESQRK